MGPAMTLIDLPHVQRFTDRHGHVRHYYRRRGHPRVALPGAPGSPEFMAAYQAASAGTASPGASAAKPGTIAALVGGYVGGARFQQLRQSTQTVQRRILDRFAQDHGDKLARDMQPRHVHAIMDKMATTPGAANKLLAILRGLMDHAVERGMRADNPARSVRRVRYREAGHPPWTEDDIAAFEAAHPTGSRARRS